MSTSVELDGGLRRDGAVDVIGGQGLAECLLCCVEVGHVGVVVLRVMELHDLGGDVWLQ